ncbi:ABC transporter permease [Wenzhouxiangella sp. XN79A]|uniref:ABC transporter permease n=1 Tax=Wenzhouxiangella sp. XN79A TaxID=2724193 RepID=UPI00144AF1EB|nr:ABC transporter permease [Wenzhouxiangella sp. XN79A]NKI34084.1 ABC transporter permease [Wenzhouxiangella sp. XN79A]
MLALNRKLCRDLWNLRAQAVAIAMVIAGGVATWVISLSTIDALDDSMRLFYQDYRFAEVFADLKRAPRSTLARIREIDGVQVAEGRIRMPATLDLAGFDEPVEALIASLPERGEPMLNRLFIDRGELPEGDGAAKVVVSESFAEAHALVPGDTLQAIVRGRAMALTITAIGLSPEYVYQIRPGALFPDYERYAVLWMRESALERAADMDGAFNSLAVALARGASTADVIDRIDDELEPWGGTGAYDRSDQTSHSYLDAELASLRAMAKIVPVIFLGVAAFLLNIVMHRLIGMQRDQIAILKAFGYRNRTIAAHYVGLVLAICLLGLVPGMIAGTWLGHGLASIYREFFRFPALYYQPGLSIYASAVLVTVAAALAGTLRALWATFRLAPAEAMRPEPPRGFRRTVLERLPGVRGMDQPTRMIARNLERRPVKSTLAVVGIALAVAILITGRFQQDTIDYMLDVQFGFSAREDLTVTLTEPAGRDALHEMASIPGVTRVEPFRGVPVELSSAHRRYRTAVQGYASDPVLHRALDASLAPIEMPDDGVLLTDWLADRLGVGAGDRVTMKLLDRRDAVFDVLVVGEVREFVGASGYMHIDALNRLLDEGDRISGAFLAVDGDRLASVFDALEERPRVAASTLRRAMIDAFNDTMGENILVFAFINTVLAATVAFGVIYNTARLSLSERSRELASLRVLGFRRSEIAWILIGELVLVTLIAIPLGCLLGTWFCDWIGRAMASEFYRIPTVIQPASYAFAAAVVLIAMLVSAVAIGRRLYHLDLVEVLKTRE